MERTALHLTLKDRIALKEVLPVEGSYLEFILIKSIQAMVEITPEDIHRHKIRQIDRGIEWDLSTDLPTKYEFTPEQFAVLRQSAQIVDQQKKVNENNFEIIRKILETGGEKTGD